MNEGAYRVLVVSLLFGICCGISFDAVASAGACALVLGVALLIYQTAVAFRQGMREASRARRKD